MNDTLLQSNLNSTKKLWACFRLHTYNGQRWAFEPTPEIKEKYGLMDNILWERGRRNDYKARYRGADFNNKRT
ncbi:MAG: hypothetical protein LC127_14125 [Chitinophagales bacterium]|nr:hypothetical protein [Chitinophagales bacterium]